MRVEKLQVGQLAANCYLVWDENTSDAVIIDPGDDADYIERRIRDFNLSPKLIIATHGHFDHVLAATELKLAFNIPFLLHRTDLPLLKRTRASAQYFTGILADPIPKVDKFIGDGEVIKFGQEELRVLATPGHTPGSISLVGNGLVFTGDTLFYQAIGRTDFRYASKETLLASIKNKLFKLPDETIVYSGHGEPTTIANEIRYISLSTAIGEEKQNLLK